MARFATVAGVSGIGLAVLGVSVPLVVPDQIPDAIRWGLVGFGLTLVLTAWVWSMLNRDGETIGAGGQSTQGSAAHAIGSVGRDVHIYTGGPARPEEREPDPVPTSPWDDPNFRLGSQEPPAPLAPLLPDMTLKEVVERVMERMGPFKDAPDRHEYHRRLNLTIADAIHLHKLKVWARFADFHLKLMSPYSLNNVRVEVGRDRIVTPNEWSKTGGNAHTDVQFLRSEIDAIWPPKGGD